VRFVFVKTVSVVTIRIGFFVLGFIAYILYKLLAHCLNGFLLFALNIR
jgi:hypothetical protein